MHAVEGHAWTIVFPLYLLPIWTFKHFTAGKVTQIFILQPACYTKFEHCNKIVPCNTIYSLREHPL